MNNDDYNVQQLRKRYDISTKRSPKLKLRGSGDLKGSSVGSKELEFNFIRNKEENVYFLIVLISNLLNRVNRSLELNFHKALGKRL